MFWRHNEAATSTIKLSGPKEIPELVGRYMVVEENVNPDSVWGLKGVIRPASKNKTFYCRVFNESQAMKAGIKVKDWNSLDGHPELILWEGYFDKETTKVRRETFVEPLSAK